MIHHVDNQSNLARSKLTQIFRYVQAFNLLQNPLRQNIQEQPWVLWIHELPDHPCIRRGTGIEAEHSSATSPTKNQNGNVADASNDDFILKVRRPQLTDPPEPPREIVPWLQSGWRDIDGKVALDPERIASFNDDPRRQELLKQWTLARNRWVQTESPARKAMDIFDRLYTLHAQLERETERVELMLGDGIIDWYPRGNDDGIHHPILLLRLQLHFNAHIPEFTLSATEHPPELYTALLQSLPDVNALNISHCRQEFEQDSVHPLGSDDTSQFLQRLVHQLSPRGEFSAQAMARTDKRFPLATRDPVLFLRSRTLGYNTALEAILESLPSQQDLPYALLSLTGIDVADNRRQNSAPSHSPLLSPNGEDEHILFSKPANAEQLEVAQQLIVHLDRGGNVKGLTLFLHRDWKTLIEQARVNGQPPTSQKHFIALLTHIRLHAARKDLTGRWQRQMAVLGAPAANTLGPEPERVCKQYIYQLRQCLDWFPMVWAPLEYEMRQYGLRWDTLLAEIPVNLAEHGDLLRLFHAIRQMLPRVLTAEINRRMYTANEAIFLALLRVLDLSSGTGANAEVVQRLRSALNNYDARAYREAFDRLIDLYERQHELHLRHTLLTKLEQCAPGWAAAIRLREGKHGERELPGDPQEAWLWRQLHDTLDRRSKTSLEELQERCVQLNNNLHRITAELVEKKAWAAQVRRTTIEQQRALQGWKELMRKVGKGTGKRAAQLLAEARRLIPKCQSAVPVWIMPLNRVVQNFDPRRNHFDVVIIDEASQADIKALAAIYMGQQVVVVGDDEQVTPMDIGQKLEQVDKLINEHLQDIPLAKLYDGRLSIYALAKTTFRPICLQEHFRCVSPIIQFSNALSYDGKIKPLRDDSEVKRRPAMVAYRVQAHETVGYINEPEAQAIASLLIAATEQPEYHDATFGVISMVNDKQAIHIDKLLQRYLSTTEYTRRQMLCGTPAHFQGDERDVIFLSMVDTPSDGPLSLRSEDAYEYMYKKRFNVAASRARDQLWVIHSLDPTTGLKDGDIRKRLILHANNPRNAMQKLAEQEKKVESEFEMQVLKRLVRAGYHVVPQWPVGAYRIDLVVERGGKRLAVECDGDRWHPIEKLEEDMARQTILERLGWRFVRIRGSHFFRNPDQALEPVFARLRALEISPEDGNISAHAVLQDGKELHDRIICRAAELRMAWAATGKRSYAQVV